MKPISRSMLVLALSAGMGWVATQAVAMPDTQTEPEEQNRSDADRKPASDQPVSDTWITTKVKADLLATEDVSGLDIKVETVNGVVTLSGRVDTQAQVDKAVAITRAIKGVSKVDSSGLTVAKKK